MYIRTTFDQFIIEQTKEYKITFKVIQSNGKDFIWTTKPETLASKTVFKINGEDIKNKLLGINLTTNPLILSYPEGDFTFEANYATQYGPASYFEPKEGNFYLNKDTEILLTYYFVERP